MKRTLTQELPLPGLQVCLPLPQWVEPHTHLSIILLAVVGGAEAGPTRGFAVAPAAAMALILSLFLPLAGKCVAGRH